MNWRKILNFSAKVTQIVGPYIGGGKTPLIITGIGRELDEASAPTASDMQAQQSSPSPAPPPQKGADTSSYDNRVPSRSTRSSSTP